MFHGGSAQNDEEPHPKSRSLEGNSLIRFRVVGFVFGFENDSIEKQCEKPQYEEKFDHEDHEVLGVVLNAGAGLRDQDLIDVVEVHTPGEQQNDQETTGDLFVVLIKNIRDGFDLILRNRLLQSGCDRHDEKCQAADPNDC